MMHETGDVPRGTSRLRLLGKVALFLQKPWTRAPATFPFDLLAGFALLKFQLAKHVSRGTFPEDNEIPRRVKGPYRITFQPLPLAFWFSLCLNKRMFDVKHIEEYLESGDGVLGLRHRRRHFTIPPCSIQRACANSSNPSEWSSPPLRRARYSPTSTSSSVGTRKSI